MLAKLLKIPYLAMLKNASKIDPDSDAYDLQNLIISASFADTSLVTFS